MKKLLSPAILCLLIISTNMQVNAQENINDSINQLRRKNVVMLTNSDSIAISYNLQGAKYDLGRISATEIPFFYTSQPMKGNLLINHFKLENLPLLYDLCSDELVYNSENGLYKLRKELVEQFSLYETKNQKHDFVNISFIPTNSKALDGYFEVIYKSEKETIYVKHRKELESRMKPNLIEYYYIPTDRYYLYHTGKYYYIKNLNSLIINLNRFNTELKNFIKKQKLSKHKLIDKQIIETLTYIDSL